MKGLEVPCIYMFKISDPKKMKKLERLLEKAAVPF